MTRKQPNALQPKSKGGGMDKEDVVHIYNGILLGHRKE